MRPLSHSSISMYQECPQKYKLKYVDGLPEKPKSFFSFGRSVHSALERFYAVPKPPAPGLDLILAHYRDNWVREGYKDAAEEDRYRAEGERILRGFHARHAPDFKPALFAEYRFNLQVDGVAVTGFVDRIDRIADRLAITDYKTGKAFGEDRVKTDAQLTMYQMACEELLGLKVESLTLYHLNSLTPITARRHDAGQVDELRGRIVRTAESIREKLFEPMPEERKCMWCDFKPFCPVFRGHVAPAPAAAGNGVRRARKAKPDPADLFSLAASPAVAVAAAPAPDPAPAAEIGRLIDRYGRLSDDAAALRREADALAGRIIALLREKGWVRAFGAAFEATLETEERWEFPDKAKVLDVIRKAGLWEEITAPSAPLVQKLMAGPSLPPRTREKLSELGALTRKDSLRCRKTSD